MYICCAVCVYAYCIIRMTWTANVRRLLSSLDVISIDSLHLHCATETKQKLTASEIQKKSIATQNNWVNARAKDGESTERMGDRGGDTVLLAIVKSDAVFFIINLISIRKFHQSATVQSTKYIARESIELFWQPSIRNWVACRINLGSSGICHSSGRSTTQKIKKTWFGCS